MKFIYYFKLLLFLICTVFSQSYDECYDLNEITYNKCNEKRNCNICSLSIYCGWCKETKKCIPIDAESKKPICSENCDEILEFNTCFKAYSKQYNEEIDLKYNNYNKPQFSPSKYEKDFYLQNNENDEFKKKKIFKKIRNQPPLQENSQQNTIQGAKQNILSFFDKIFKQKL